MFDNRPHAAVGHAQSHPGRQFQDADDTSIFESEVLVGIERHPGFRVTEHLRVGVRHDDFGHAVRVAFPNRVVLRFNLSRRRRAESPGDVFSRPGRGQRGTVQPPCSDLDRVDRLVGRESAIEQCLHPGKRTVFGGTFQVRLDSPVPFRKVRKHSRVATPPIFLPAAALARLKLPLHGGGGRGPIKPAQPAALAVLPPAAARTRVVLSGR
jgi:hypothetical protein